MLRSSAFYWTSTLNKRSCEGGEWWGLQRRTSWRRPNSEVVTSDHYWVWTMRCSLTEAIYTHSPLLVIRIRCSSDCRIDYPQRFVPNFRHRNNVYNKLIIHRRLREQKEMRIIHIDAIRFISPCVTYPEFQLSAAREKACSVLILAYLASISFNNLEYLLINERSKIES